MEKARSRAGGVLEHADGEADRIHGAAQIARVRHQVEGHDGLGLRILVAQPDEALGIGLVGSELRGPEMCPRLAPGKAVGDGELHILPGQPGRPDEKRMFEHEIVAHRRRQPSLGLEVDADPHEGMLLQIGPHARTFRPDGDPERLQLIARTDPGPHQDARRMQRAGGDDESPGPRSFPSAPRDGPGRPPPACRRTRSAAKAVFARMCRFLRSRVAPSR